MDNNKETIAINNPTDSSIETPPKVNFVILQYNNSQDTIKCLASVLKSNYENFSIIVVDNSSNPDHLKNTGEFVKNQLNIELIESPVNTGYAGGNNLGFKKSIKNRAEYLFVLNNDTSIEADTLSTLVKEAQLKKNKSIIAPVIKESKRKIYGGTINWLKSELSHIEDLSNKNPDYLTGAGLLIPKEIIKKTKGFDERYFLYFEDADFCLRAKKEGFDLDVCRNSFIQHEVSSSTKKLGSSTVLRYHIRNSHLFNSIHAPWYFRVFLPIWSSKILIKQFVKLIIGINKEESKAIIKGVSDFYKGKWGKI